MADFSAYKVADAETSSFTKFDGFVQAVEDAINAIGALTVSASQISGYPSDATRYLAGNGAWLKLVHGRVKSDGTVRSGTGFTPSKIGTGHYRITFATAFGAAPAFAPGVESNDTSYLNRYPSVAGGSITASVVDVFFNDAAGSAADTNFSFVAAGTGS